MCAQRGTVIIAKYNDRFSIAWLMGFVTFATFFAWQMKLATEGSSLSTILVGAILVAMFPFLFYAAAFACVYPFGVLSEFLDRASQKPQSPFANDRLPQQQVVPLGDSDHAH